MSESKTSYGGRLSLSTKPVFCPDFLEVEIFTTMKFMLERKLIQCDRGLHERFTR